MIEDDGTRHAYGIVIPNRYADVIQPLLESIQKYIPEPRPEIIIIADGHQRNYGFKRLAYTDPLFVFAKAVNIGIRALQGKDVILVNDDCVVLEYDFFHNLYLAMKSRSTKIGILSPLIKGCVGNPVQRWHDRDKWWFPGMEYQKIDQQDPDPLCFPCVYLAHKMLHKTGLLDEGYASYGGEDENLCMKARKYGWTTEVTNKVCIQHGDGSDELESGRGRSWSTSYARRWQGGSPPHKDVDDYLKRNGLKELKEAE